MYGKEKTAFFNILACTERRKQYFLTSVHVRKGKRRQDNAPAKRMPSPLPDCLYNSTSRGAENLFPVCCSGSALRFAGFQLRFRILESKNRYSVPKNQINGQNLFTFNILILVNFT